MTKDMLFSREGQIGLITLNRPGALNALSLEMIIILQKQLLQWEKDKSIRAFLIQGTGKAFCAGGDVRWLYDVGISGGMDKRPEQMQFFWHEYRLNYFIHYLNKPYIALMDGMTMGGGVGISLHGSHPIATDHFSFAMPETGIGFFPDIGASYLLSRCPDSIGTYLGLTGIRLNAKEAYSLGLVKSLIASSDVNQILHEMIQSNLSKDPTEAHNQINTYLSQYSLHRSEATQTFEKEQQEKIRHYFSKNTVEEIFLALESSNDDWEQNVLKILKQKAPLSLKVTLAQLRRAKSMSLANCLNMDYCLVKRFMKDANFYEGVRALLVDKDKSPRWQPASLEEISENQVTSFFEFENDPLNLELDGF